MYCSLQKKSEYHFMPSLSSGISFRVTRLASAPLSGFEIIADRDLENGERRQGSRRSTCFTAYPKQNMIHYEFLKRFMGLSSDLLVNVILDVTIKLVESPITWMGNAWQAHLGGRNEGTELCLRAMKVDFGLTIKYLTSYMLQNKWLIFYLGSTKFSTKLINWDQNCLMQVESNENVFDRQSHRSIGARAVGKGRGGRPRWG